MIEFGLESLSLHWTWARANPENTGSWSVMRKLGMRREGHVREVELVGTGEWRDISLYAIQQREWK